MLLVDAVDAAAEQVVRAFVRLVAQKSAAVIRDRGIKRGKKALIGLFGRIAKADGLDDVGKGIRAEFAEHEKPVKVLSIFPAHAQEIIRKI